MKVRTKLVAGAALVGLIASLYWLLHHSGALATIMDASALRMRVAQMGHWGPVAIVALMVLAILVSPIPSAPIALAAGAAYGHGWGTVYVVLGAQAGATAAFALARFVGFETMQRWFGGRLSSGLIGSQNALMGIVFVSRLLPFVSFDIVSYGAGLTVLSFWRFGVATFAGVIPISFLLTHFGSEMGTGETWRILFSGLALGALTAIPIVAKLFGDWRARRQRARAAKPD